MARLDALRSRVRQTRPRDRWFLGIGGAAIGALLLGLLWIIVTGIIANSRLNDVRDSLRELRTAVTSGDIDKARELEMQIRDKAASAHELTSGPAWWVGANLPVLGSPLETTRTITTQADRLGSEVVPGTLELVNTLLKTPPKNATINLAPLRAAEPVLARASAITENAQQLVQRSPGSWLPFVRDSRDELARELDKLDTQLQGASRTVRVALPMLGSQRPQRYFIGFMNEAESRPLGGVPGAFAIVTATNGAIRFETFGSDDDLKGVRAKISLDADYLARYSQDDPAGVIQNSDVSPDFRDAGRIWAGMWKAKTGETVDGAIALDPTALSYLLAATGPARLDATTTVTAANVVRLTQQKQYSLFPSISYEGLKERKRYLTGLARAVAGKLTAGGGDSKRLLTGAAYAVHKRRLMLWNADPAIERALVDANWAGTLEQRRPGGAYSGFTVTNAAGSKLDYYLQRTMAYRRSGCEQGATAVATLTLRNDAPTRGLPPYVTYRADDKAGLRHKPGDNKLILSYFVTAGSRVDSVTLNGKPLVIAPGTENGLVTLNVTLELPVGSTRQLSITTSEPAVSAPVEILRQPLVRELAVRQSGERCGD